MWKRIDMKKMNLIGGIVLVAFGLSPKLAAGPYADQVVSYQTGSLPANLKSFTNAFAVLGAPSRETPGAFGGPVDPFSPPYLNSQLVSIGEGGSLTVRFEEPVVNLDQKEHLYGLDFLVYGNAGFVITNGNFSGGGITDGTLFGQAKPGGIQVLVSANNRDYYALKSALAPVIDSYYPTDGSGSFGIPVDPRLGSGDFAGRNLSELRALYAGSAGGSGFDLDWAVDEQGSPVFLDAISYLRIEVLSGHIDLEGFTAVTLIPEPCTGWLLFGGGLLLAWKGLPRSGGAERRKSTTPDQRARPSEACLPTPVNRWRG